MTQYLNPSFSVVKGSRDPEDCDHGWLDRRGRCTFCGEIPTVKEDHPCTTKTTSP